MPNFGPKAWVTPLEKCQFFDFLKLLFLQPKKAFFRSTISYKAFSWSILPKKKKLEKWPFLNQSHGLTPLEKCQLFDFLKLLFLQPKKAFFRSTISYKAFSWSILPKKKKLEKWPFLNQSHGLTPLEKCHFFRLFELLFFLAQKGVFSFQNIVRDIFLWYIAEKEKVKKRPIFGPKSWVNPFGKMSIFRLFELLVFLVF